MTQIAEKQLEDGKYHPHPAFRQTADMYIGRAQTARAPLLSGQMSQSWLAIRRNTGEQLKREKSEGRGDENVNLNAKAMVMEEFNAPLQLREVSMEMSRDVIVVEILAAGICGSDIHMWRANDPRVSLPLVLGHEAVGRIISLPCEKHDLYGVKLAEGDLVMWNRGMTCGRCQACVLWKQPALCSQRWTYGINPPAEFGLLQGDMPPTSSCGLKLTFEASSEADDLTAMVIASCSGATAAHALDLISIRQDETVLVQGLWSSGAVCCGFSQKPWRQGICHRQRPGALVACKRTGRRGSLGSAGDYCGGEARGNFEGKCRGRCSCGGCRQPSCS